MRSVSVRARGATLLLLLVLFSAVPAIAGTEPQPPIQVPVAVTTEEEPPSVWELFLVWLQHRIHVPGG